MAREPRRRLKGAKTVMIERHPSDEEIIAKMEKSSRAQWRLVRTSLFMLAGMVAILFGGMWLHLPMQLLGGVASALLLIWLVSVFRNRDYLPPPEAYFDETILRKTIDIQHRRWRWSFVLFFGLIVEMTLQLTHNILRTSHAALQAGYDEHFADIMVAGAFGFIALTTMLQVCFGPGFLMRYYRRALNDELTRSQQHRAAKLGYILAVVAMCAVLVAAMYRTSWGILALPGAIAAVIVLPGFYFLILQWRAGRDG